MIWDFNFCLLIYQITYSDLLKNNNYKLIKLNSYRFLFGICDYFGPWINVMKSHKIIVNASGSDTWHISIFMTNWTLFISIKFLFLNFICISILLPQTTETLIWNAKLIFIIASSYCCRFCFAKEEKKKNYMVAAFGWFKKW